MNEPCKDWDMHHSWYALPERHEHLRKTVQAMAAILTDYAHNPVEACRLAGWIGLNGSQGTLSETIAAAKGDQTACPRCGDARREEPGHIYMTWAVGGSPPPVEANGSSRFQIGECFDRWHFPKEPETLTGEA